MKRFLPNTLAWLAALVSVAQAYGQDVVTYYHSDNAGSPIAATDQNSNTLWTEEYTPYGERWTTDINSVSNRQWFTGHTADKETNLVYAGARYYDPVIGRFLGIDPAGIGHDDPFAFNTYGYGRNNPYAYVDPDGMEPGEAVFGLMVGLLNTPENARKIQQAEVVAGNYGAAGAIDAGVAIADVKRQVDSGASIEKAAVAAAVVLVRQIADKKKGRTTSPGKRPPNMSPAGAGRSGAFNEARRANGIPTSQQPSRTLPNADRRGNPQPGRIYEYEVPAPGGGTRTIRIRDDAAGDSYPDDPTQNRGPHFNDPSGNHYDY